MASIELDRQQAKAGHLPPVCIYCGAPATAYRMKHFTGSTPVTIFVGGGFARARIPVCLSHRWHSFKRGAVALGFFAIMFALAILLSNLDAKPRPPEWLAPLKPWKGVFVTIVLVSLLGMIVARFYGFYTDIRCRALYTNTIEITGVSEEFVAACAGMYEQPVYEQPVDVQPIAPIAAPRAAAHPSTAPPPVNRPNAPPVRRPPV